MKSNIALSLGLAAILGLAVAMPASAQTATTAPATAAKPAATKAVAAAPADAPKARQHLRQEGAGVRDGGREGRGTAITYNILIMIDFGYSLAQA